MLKHTPYVSGNTQALAVRLVISASCRSYQLHDNDCSMQSSLVYRCLYGPALQNPLLDLIIKMYLDKEGKMAFINLLG